jgi:hypothetical protein
MATLPPFIDTDVKLLLTELTSPEMPVKFDAPPRSTPGTIQSTINPPQATWTWPTQAARDAEVVADVDVGKYGLETDVNRLFRLASASPTPVWQPVQDFTCHVDVAEHYCSHQPARVAGRRRQGRIPIRHRYLLLIVKRGSSGMAASAKSDQYLTADRNLDRRRRR